MAKDPATSNRRSQPTPPPPRARVPWWNVVGIVRPYGTLVASRLQSQTVYGKVFWLEVVGITAFMLAELAEILVYFHNTRTFGGMSVWGLFVMLGLSSLSFATCKTVVGHLDQTSRFIREGTLEVFYTRPLSILGQLMTCDLDVRRIGRALTALPMLGFGLWHSEVACTPSNIALICVAVICGTAIFASLFVIAGSLQFFLIQAQELSGTLTYATNYVAQLPTSIFPRGMQWVYLFVLPAAFVSYLPTLELLGVQHTFWMPPGAAWFAPAAAASSCILAGLIWRAGVNRYQSAGG